MKLNISLSKKQKEFFESIQTFDVTGYGGAKGGGKSAGARLSAIIECLTKPKIKCCIFRKTYPELKDNHIIPLFQQFPIFRKFYNAQEKTISFPNGSILFFRYCENLDDVFRLAGREFQRIFIDEACDWSYEAILALIRNCNRSSLKNIKASTALMFNWGGISHSDLKRVFYEKQFFDNEKKLSWNFILAKVEDNPILMNTDPGYLLKLEAEPNPHLRKAYRFGDPEIAFGRFFNELNPEFHVIENFKIPTHWNWFGGYDYGFFHPCAIVFCAIDEDGVVYVVDEIYEEQLSIEEQIFLIHEKIKKHEIKKIIFHAGHDCWARKKGNDPTIAEDFIRANIIFQKANIDRVLGWRNLREYLAVRKNQTRLKFFKEAKRTFTSCLSLTISKNNFEDVEKSQRESIDDGADALRYALMSRPFSAKKSEEQKKIVYDFERDRGGSWMTI